MVDLEQCDGHFGRNTPSFGRRLRPGGTSDKRECSEVTQYVFLIAKHVMLKVIAI